MKINKAPICLIFLAFATVITSKVTKLSQENQIANHATADNTSLKQKMIINAQSNIALEKLYQTKLGALERKILKRPLTSKAVGIAMDSLLSKPFIKIYLKKHPDIKKHADEFECPNGDITAFKSFNEFFYRKLSKKGLAARPIDKNPNAVVSPSDCHVVVIPKLKKTDNFYVKQSKFNLNEFLSGSKAIKANELTHTYKDGTLLLFRLAPDDYHRFHFPFDCIPSAPLKIPGVLESVNPIAYTPDVQPLTENIRHLIILKSKVFGDVLCMVVGAMMVGSIIETYKPDIKVHKGDEMGYFAFGGSSIVLIFKKDVVKVNSQLIKNSKKLLDYEKIKGMHQKGKVVHYPETVLHMGETIAKKIKK